MGTHPQKETPLELTALVNNSHHTCQATEGWSRSVLKSDREQVWEFPKQHSREPVLPDSGGDLKSCWLLSVRKQNRGSGQLSKIPWSLLKKEHLATSSITFLFQLTSLHSPLIFQSIIPSSKLPYVVSNFLWRQLHTTPSK